MVRRNQHTVLDAADGCVADVALGCVPALRPRFSQIQVSGAFANRIVCAPVPIDACTAIGACPGVGAGRLPAGTRARPFAFALRPELQPGEGTAHRWRWAHGGCSYPSLVGQMLIRESVTPCDLQAQSS